MIFFDEEDFKESPYINIDNETHEEGYVYLVNKDYIEENAEKEVITVVKTQKEILLLFVKHEPLEPIAFALNETYTAQICNKSVKVGCQTFSFDKVKELYKIICEREESLKSK